MRGFSLLILLMLSVFDGVIGQSRHEMAAQLYQGAQEAYRSSEYDRALEQIEESLRIKETAKGNYLHGLVLEALGRDLRAVAAFEAVLKLDPEHREAVFQKALIYLNYGDPAQALEDFNQLIESGSRETRGVYFQIDPLGQAQNSVVSMATIRSRLFGYRGQCYEKLGDYELALQDYNEAILQDPKVDYYISRALLHSKLDQTDDALRDLKTAVTLEPENQLAWYNLTLMDPSVTLPDDLMKESSFAPTLGLLASRAMEEGKYQMARKYFDQSLLNNPEDALAYVNRGRVLLKMEDYSAARADFNEARRIEPTRTETLYLVGNSYFFEENYQAAIAYYDQYLTVDPTNGMVWYNAAISYLEQDKYQEACHYLKKAHTLGMAQAKSLAQRYCE